MTTLPPEQRLTLLRRFEPAIRYTTGELFFPMSVEDYVAASRLVETRGDEKREVAPRGSLTLDRLAELGRADTSQRLSLEHVDKALDRKAYRQWRRRPGRDHFRASSRFAAVGLLARLIDSIMRLTLLLRGSVPGGLAAAAQQLYAASAHHDQAVYYGHVTEDGGYTVLQYWYFYAMNDWRSTFGGVNDHEADWEQVTIYLVPDEVASQDGDDAGGGDPTRLRPAWVAFSSHDEVGDDLRRRWDDPDLTLVGDHPVVYAGAGSHSGAYLEGEYLIGVGLPQPAWFRRLVAVFRGEREEESGGGLRIPYLDYKRGDGLAVGAGGDRSWTAVLVDDTTPWVRDYSGLWGLDTSDPFGGERAPAGPRYERNGRVRQSWGQPVAWSGLDKVPPSRALALARMEHVRADLVARMTQLDGHLSVARERLRGGYSAERALGLRADRPGAQVRELDEETTRLRTEQAQLQQMLEGVDHALAAPIPEEPVHGHLRHRALPIDQTAVESGRVVRVWTAASASILLGALGVLMLRGDAPLFALLSVAGVMLVIEAVLRRQLFSLVIGAAVVGLAFVGLWAIVSVVLGNLRAGFGILLIAAAVYLGISTLSEALKTR